MTFAKVVLHQLRSALGNAQIGADVAHQLLLVDGADAAERVGFHVLVQQFIGIQFRAVGRKPEELDARRVLCQPATHRRRLVHGVAIQNQKHFPGDQTQQATQKIQKDRRGEALVKNHEGQSTAIGDCRDQVAAEALTGARHHGKVFLILDRHPVHKSAPVSRWLEKHAARIQLFWLPSYSPELNPDELLNQDVKTNALGRVRPIDQQELMGNVRSYLRITQSRPQLVQHYFRERHVQYAAL